MKTIKVISGLFFSLFMLTQAWTQEHSTAEGKSTNELNKKVSVMKTYVIEREIPDAGKLTEAQLKGISHNSNKVLAAMGPGIAWLHSYVTEDKVYCVYQAENEMLLREHAAKGEFPINKISELSTQIGPETAKN